MTGRSFAVGTVLQYVVFLGLAYVLAGAPLLSILAGSTGASKKSRASFGRPPPLSPDKAATLVIPEKNLTCGEHAFRGVHVLSREPLVVYIEGFLGQDEVQHVVDIRYAFYWRIQHLPVRRRIRDNSLWITHGYNHCPPIPDPQQIDSVITHPNDSTANHISLPPPCGPPAWNVSTPASVFPTKPRSHAHP